MNMKASKTKQIFKDNWLNKEKKKTLYYKIGNS